VKAGLGISNIDELEAWLVVNKPVPKVDHIFRRVFDFEANIVDREG